MELFCLVTDTVAVEKPNPSVVPVSQEMGLAVLLCRVGMMGLREYGLSTTGRQVQSALSLPGISQIKHNQIQLTQNFGNFGYILVN
jgi:hypothetical protein